MDKNEENYWLNLEKIFVHHVYENQNDSNQNDLLKQEINGNTNDANKYAYTPWPKVKKFLSRLEPDSLIADIGCGEGKYLNINNKIYSFGCDRSISLCDLAIKNINSKCQILVCDNLALPFRSDLFDAIISIGVIHHFSTETRRIKAIQELSRITRSGGKIMITVWAMEQKTRIFKSQDILVPLINNKQQEISDSNSASFSTIKSQSNEKDLYLENSNSDNNQNINIVDNIKLFFLKKFSLKTNERNDAPGSPIVLISPFSSNELSKSFNFDDTLQRYKKIIEEHKSILPKDFTIRKFPNSSCTKTFDQNESSSSKTISNSDNASQDCNKRFYHVFKENELNELMKNHCEELNIYSSYYDHGNWCICATKK